jgi:hypothetical protein
MDETIEVVVKQASEGLSIGADSIHTYTISDNDNVRDIDFSISSSSGNESSSPAFLTIRINTADPTTPTSVNYTVTGGTASSNVDFVLADGIATIAPNQFTTTIPISIIDELSNEDDETIIITLSNPVNANIGTNTTHTYTILNDDPLPEVGYIIDHSNGSENTAPAYVFVALSNRSGKTITVDYTISGGTASGAGVDYNLIDGTLTFLPGDSIISIDIDPVDDAIIETEETITVDLFNVNTNGLIGVITSHTFTINNDDFTGFSGPGGVGDEQTNKLWLSSDTLVTLNTTDVITWGDLSGNHFDAINLGFGQEPELVLGELNNKPVIRFDDNGGTNGDYLGANQSLGIAGSAPATIYMVAKNTTTSNDDNTGFFIGESSGAGGNIRHYGIEYAHAVRFNNGNRIFDDGYTLNDWKIGVFRNASGAQYGQYEAFMNGSLLGQISSANPTTIPNTVDDLYYIGAGLVSGAFRGSRYFNGDFAELIVYNTEINEAQRNIVDNYLSSKYGIAVATDLYSFDALHGNDLAGIGMLDATNFHIAAQSAGILKIFNPDNLANGEYMLFGHDNGAYQSWVTSEIPGPQFQRISREWRVNISGNPGEVFISVDTTRLSNTPAGYVDYVLIVDDNDNFTSGAQIIPLSKQNGEYEASGISLSDGDYLSVGIIRSEVQFSLANSNISENSLSADINLELNYARTEDLTIDYSITGGTASSGIDYNLADGSVIIPKDSTSGQIVISILDDFIVEPD